MSLPPYRPPVQFNKYLLCANLRNKDWELRRPDRNCTTFCSTDFFERLDPVHPFREAHFPAGVPYRPVLTEKQCQVPGHIDKATLAKKDPLGAKRWGHTVDGHPSEWRTSFPDRMHRLAGHDSNKSTGEAVFRPALESIPNGREDISLRRLKFLEKTAGGEIFRTRARNERWDRFREGAASIPTIPIHLHKTARAPFGSVRYPGDSKNRMIFRIDSSQNSSQTGSRANSTSSEMMAMRAMSVPPRPATVGVF